MNITSVQFRINWIELTLKSFDRQNRWIWNPSTPWISNQQNFKPFEPQSIKFPFSWISNQINWISNHLKRKSIEFQTEWPANYSNLKANDFQTNWIPYWNHLNLKPSKSHITWTSSHLLEFQVIYLNLKPFEPQINDWQSKHLSLESIDNQPLESQVNGQQNHLNLKTVEPRITWIILNLKVTHWLPNFKAVESQMN